MLLQAAPEAMDVAPLEGAVAQKGTRADPPLGLARTAARPTDTSLSVEPKVGAGLERLEI
jgi:hypothetical protein